MLDVEREFEEAAHSARRQRYIAAAVTGAAATLFAGLGIAVLAKAPLQLSDGMGYALVGAGILELALALESLLVKTPVERAWQFYLEDSRLTGDGAPATPALTVRPTLGPTLAGVVAGFSGTF